MDLQPAKRSSLPPRHNVNLYCDECNSQIGIFDNEWIRLTASYARSKEKGTNFGTEVGRSTQVVPDGKSAAGCTMADIFCKKCSRTIGQFCKSAPSADKQHFVDHYFYRLSRVYLKDRETSSRVEPQFGYGSDIAKTSTRSSMGLQNQGTPRPRSSEISRGRTHNPHSTTPAAQGQPATARLYPMQIDDEGDWLDQQGEDNSGDHFSDVQHTFNSGTRFTSKSIDINEQVLLMSSQLTKLQSTVNHLVDVVHGLQPNLSTHRHTSADNGNADQFEAFIQSMRSTVTHAGELERLRKENKSMKVKLDNIASAMGTAALGQIMVQSGGSTSPIASVEDATILGKRKRQDQGSSKKSLRPEAAASQKGVSVLKSWESQEQVLTPHSTGPSNSSSQFSPSQENIEPGARAATHTETDPQHAGESGSFTAEEIDFESTEIFQKDCSTLEERPPTGMPLREDSTVPSYPIFEHQTDNDLTDIGTTKMVAKESNELPPVGEIPPNVEFSDDEPLSGTTAVLDENMNDTVQDIIVGHADTDPDAVSYSEQVQNPQQSESNAEHIDGSNDKINKAAEGRRSRRRITDSVVNHQIRSMAPEPAPRRRTLLSTRSKATSLDKAEISTPQTIEQKIKNKGKPRERKPHVQTTERLLNLELEELGLSEWIGKEKKSAEYRAAVDQARTRQREANKLAKLSNTGLTANPIIPTDIQLSERPPFMSSAEQWNNPGIARQYLPPVGATTSMHAHPLSDVTNQQGNRPEMATSEPQSKIPQAMTRKQKQEEIRKRDQMAKEAIERESLA